MLTTQEICKHLEQLKYKDGWAFTCYDGRWEGQHMVITTNVPDAFKPGEMTTLDVHSMLPPIPDTAYLESWLMWRLARIEVHEMREFFKRKNAEGKYLVVDSPHAPHSDKDL